MSCLKSFVLAYIIHIITLDLSVPNIVEPYLIKKAKLTGSFYMEVPSARCQASG